MACRDGEVPTASVLDGGNRGESGATADDHAVQRRRGGRFGGGGVCPGTPSSWSATANRHNLRGKSRLSCAQGFSRSGSEWNGNTFGSGTPPPRKSCAS